MESINNIYLFIHSFICLHPYFLLFFNGFGKIINRRMVQRLVNTELEKNVRGHSKCYLGRPEQNHDYPPRQNVIRLSEMFLNKTRTLACKHENIPIMTTVKSIFFLYFADRASQYIYFLILTNLMH